MSLHSTRFRSDLEPNDHAFMVNLLETIPVPPLKPIPDYLVEEPVALLNGEQLERIAQSSAIKEMLQNEGLRRLIQMIDSSENPEYLLDKARKENRQFMEFSEEILAIAEREPGESGTEQVLEALGMGRKS
ncbi:hypothetical protein BGZ65_006613 [Modicella reniformis]|uniref:Zinc finger HIT domain-containing protein n=1 Tax=Modicella reniformis TaxID=1440133 RepID=A0A9P6IN72_9FUNG|nr:hypothetical protein BGZ65_006613 [Modicella reniformis]